MGKKNVLKKGGGKLRNEDLVLEQEVCMCALACVLFCFVLFFFEPSRVEFLVPSNVAEDFYMWENASFPLFFV